jgi:hypothetical protein
LMSIRSSSPKGRVRCPVGSARSRVRAYGGTTVPGWSWVENRPSISSPGPKRAGNCEGWSW